jgi:hypothetical protein
MNDKEEKAIWIEFAKATIQGYDVPEDIEDFDALVDDIADLSEAVADAMVERFSERFNGGGGGRRRPRRGARPRDRGEAPDEKD